MSDGDTGGPAFPKPHTKLGPGHTKLDGSDGMTLRDWFAGQALAGHLASMNPGSLDRAFCDHVAQQSYWVADAMIAERNKP